MALCDSWRPRRTNRIPADLPHLNLLLVVPYNVALSTSVCLFSKESIVSVSHVLLMDKLSTRKSSPSLSEAV